MTRLIRHARLYRVFWENCFAREAEFRANFWANVVTNTGWLFFFVAFVKVIFLNTRRVGEWSEAETLVLTGTFGVIQGLFNIVAYQNLSRFPEMVRLGTLDFVITKPVNSLFLVATRYVKLDSIGNVAGACLIIAHGLQLADYRPGLPEIAAYLALGAYFSIYTLLMTLAFWFIRVENLAVLADVIFGTARYPIDIFRPWNWLWSLFVYVLPLAFVSSFPALALFGKLPAGWMALGPFLAALLFLACTAFWRLGIRSYSSASS